MSNNFSRTLRALRTDGLTGWSLRALVATLLLSVWAAWFFWGRITVWAVSDSARAEVRNEVVQVDSPVEGQVVVVHIARGQEVAVGDLLVELETFREEGQRDSLIADLEGRRTSQTELSSRIRQEENSLGIWLRASRAGVEETRSRVTQAEAAAEAARQKEGRTRRLHGENLVPDEELEEAVSELKQRDAELDSAGLAAERAERELESSRADRQTKIDELRGQLSVADSAIRSLQARIDSLEQEVGQRQIRASIDGTLARVANLTPGSVVELGDELARIVPSGAVRAVAHYRAADAVGRIEPGQPARMRLDGFPSTQFGTVAVTVALVDNEPTEEGLIRVDLDVAPDPATAIDVQHGMVGTIEVEVDRLSPASMLMRAVGKLLDRPAQVSSS